MKTQHFTLSIPEPCSEAWEQMTPCGSGKFCDSCQKTVIDFTDFSDAQIAAFFADKRGESVCGRFYAAQIEEAVFSYVAPAKKSYPTLATAASVAVLTVLSFTAEGKSVYQAPQLASPAANDLMTQSTVKSATDTLTIKGIVKDETGELLFNASVKVFSNNKLVGSSITDLDGRYEISLPKTSIQSDSLRLFVRFTGYKENILMVSVPDISAGDLKTVTLLKVACEKPNDKSVIIRVGGIRYSPVLPHAQNPGSGTIITAPQLEKMPR